MITLKTLPHATAQEVFDQVKNHLLQQNEKAYSNDTGCVYRSNNLKCAAGCLISDSEYDVKFENESWTSLVLSNRVPEKHRALITELQITHDDYDVENWERRLKHIAKENNLIWK